MSKFTEFNNIRPLIDENLWITTKELVFYENDDLTGKKRVVECWFKTDWCSVSCPFWQWAKPRTIPACVLHDYLWDLKIGFWKSNLLFYKAMRANKVWFIERSRYYLGVTLFGWLIYWRIVDRISDYIKDRLDLSHTIASKTK